MTKDELKYRFADIHQHLRNLHSVRLVAPSVQPALSAIVDYTGKCVVWADSLHPDLVSVSGNIPGFAAKLDTAIQRTYDLSRVQGPVPLADDTSLWFIVDNIDEGIDLLKRLPGSPTTPYPIPAPPDKPRR